MQSAELTEHRAPNLLHLKLEIVPFDCVFKMKTFQEMVNQMIRPKLSMSNKLEQKKKPDLSVVLGSTWN